MHGKRRGVASHRRSVVRSHPLLLSSQKLTVRDETPVFRLKNSERGGVLRMKENEAAPGVLGARALTINLRREPRPRAVGPAFLQKMESAIVRRSLPAQLWRRLQAWDQTLTQTFSWQGLKLRLQALRTGRSVAEVELISRVIYRVEELFLIHRGTCQLLLHAHNRGLKKDPRMVAEMLSTIQDYTPAVSPSEQATALEEFRVAGLQVWIASSEHGYLVAVIRGNPPPDLRGALEQTLYNVQNAKTDALANFDGNATDFLPLRPALEACLIADYREARVRPRGQRRLKILVAAVAGVMAAAIFLGFRREWRWNNYVSRLEKMPGIVVSHAQRGWTEPSQIAGLRDPLAADPALVARQMRLDPAGIRFDWKEFQTPEPALALRRFEITYAPPATVSTRLEDGVLYLTGSASHEWIERVKQDAAKIPGIRKVVDRKLDIVFSPESVLQRFIARFGLPEGMEARMGPKNRVVLWGEATHAWLARVRSNLKEIPGASDLDDRNVLDLDLETYKKTKKAVEETSIAFLPEKDELAPAGLVALSRATDHLRRCLEAAKRLNYRAVVEISGSAPAAAGSGASNADLGQRRATAVRVFLLGSDFEPGAFLVVNPEKVPPTAEVTPEQTEPEVRFRMVLKSRVAAP